MVINNMGHIYIEKNYSRLSLINSVPSTAALKWSIFWSLVVLAIVESPYFVILWIVKNGIQMRGSTTWLIEIGMISCYRSTTLNYPRLYYLEQRLKRVTCSEQWEGVTYRWDCKKILAVVQEKMVREKTCRFGAWSVFLVLYALCAFNGAVAGP